MRELFRRLMLHPWLALEIAVASMFASLLALASPLFVIQVLNRYIAHGVDGTLVTLASGTVLAIVLELLFRQIRGRLARDISTDANYEVSTGGFGLLIKARAGSLEQVPPGQRRQLVGAAGAIESAYGPGNIAAVYDVPFALLFIAVLYLLNGVLSGIVAVFLVVVFVIGSIGAMSIRSLTGRLIQVGGSGNAMITTAADQIDTVRAFNGGEILHGNWQHHTITTQRLRSQIERRQGLVQTLTQTAIALMGVTVVATGARLVVGGEINVGVMIGANILAARALMPVSRFSQLGAIFAKAAQSLSLIREFTKLPLEPDSGSSKKNYSGAVEFKDVSFSYPGSNTPLFESLSLRIEPGNVVVITGGNGAGKTALARLLVGLIEPVRGHVL
ncbi:MAG TPA: ATP-binding cassette domain-containing protein, partial [Rhodospirillales bacterium]|nr:ATP-binding cassette domain-containing protein [Rhodospirillales bacterium]